MQSYDVIIIGAGPIGLACAVEAQKNNLSYLILEKGRLVNSIYGYPVYMRFFSTSDLLEIGGIPFITQGEKPSRYEALEYYRRVADTFQFNLRAFETVTGVDGEDGNFFVKTETREYNARKVIAAIGYFDRPRMLDVPGEELPKVSHYYQEPHYYTNHNILLVGSGNSAVEAALETHRHGAKVTMAVRGPQLKPGVKYWIRPDMETRIAKGEIQGYFNTAIREIRPDSVILQTKNEAPFEVPNDLVLALTGYRPDFQLLDNLGVELLEDEYNTPRHDPNTYETNRKGLYLAGVVVGGLQTDKWFIENSRDHARVIFDQLT
ncbi:YpdA family putative bacillithiol disulfide reductase [bacterium]|nr:YpdA family putative bacillithiol disulfide reductase [bacterium]